MQEMKNNIKNKIKTVLRNLPGIKLSILYGSSLNDLKNKINDIDIAVAAEKKIDYNLLADLQIALEKELQYTVDLIDINTINGPILQQILCNGEILICNDHNLYANIMKRMIYFQADMMPNYTMILKERAERFANG